jgi:superfamily I DNA/RNA helicase
MLDSNYGDNMTPTPEQQAILDAFESIRNNIKVLALAGTGKTSTLLELVQKHPEKNFLYLAFNRAIKDEVDAKAKTRKIKNLRVKTQNGFCLALAKDAGCKCRDIKGYLSVKETIARLGLTSDDRFLANPAFQIMRRFMASSDTEMTLRHVPKEIEDRFCTQLMRFAKMSGDKLLQAIDKKKKRALEIAQKLFSSFSFSSDLMLHDMYVKLVQLHYSTIDIAEDVVLLDEAQDINPVFSDIASKINARLIAVGDSNQAIYQFRGAQDFLKDMPAEATFTLTQSFRFLPEIADKANLLLEHMTDLRIKGFEGVEEDDSEAILCRTNMGCLTEAFQLLDAEKPFTIDGGVDNEGFKMIEDIVSLYNGNAYDVQHIDLKGLRNFSDFEKELEEDLLNIEWKTALRVIDKIGGYDSALDSLRKLKDSQRNVPANAVVITTMHKSKGKEWNTVTIANDAENVFYRSDMDEMGRKVRIPIPFSEAPVTEKNLFYVAVTRAKRNLELGLCSRLFPTEDANTANTTN